MIILDLEWNSGYAPGALEEIIQIGAVRLAAPGGPVDDTFNVYIRPVLHKKLSVGAKKLPDVGLSLSSDLDFHRGYQAFLAWCGEETVFASWGTQDLRVLDKNAAYWKEPALRAENRLDLQAAYGRMVGSQRCISLEEAAQACGVTAEVPFHNALHDAVYTAWVSGSISPEALSAPPAEKKKRRKIHFAACSPEAMPPQVSVSFTRKKHGLNDRALRRVVCPGCGKVCTTTHWYPFDELTHYGTATCGDCGSWLCRLSMEVRKNGWRGTRTVLPLTEDNLAAFNAAREHTPHRCAAGSHQKKKRRYVPPASSAG